MRRPFPAALVLVLLAAVAPADPALSQTLDEPAELLAAYATIARQYQQGDETAASRLLALGPLRVKTLHELMGHAIARRPELLARETSPWTPALLRAAALLHTDIALPAFERRDAPTFEQHAEAADRLLLLSEQREPAGDLRPRWHVMVGLHLLAAGDVTGARRFLTRSCQALPARAQVRLACGIASDVYASILKMAPPDPADLMDDRARAAAQREDAQRELARERAKVLADAEAHLKAAMAADPSLDEARLRLAWIHVERGNDPEAEPLLAPLAARGRPVPLAYLARLMLGGIRERQGLAGAAATLYREASALMPKAPRAGMALAHALHASGDRAAARQILDGLVTRRLNPPDDPWIHYRVAFIGTPRSTLDDLRLEVRK